MMPAPMRAGMRTALIMLAFTVVGTALLAVTFERTRPAIARSEEAARLSLITQVLPKSDYDNDLLRDAVELPPQPQLGTTQPTTVYRARRAGAPVAVVLEAVAPDGYSGRIRMLLAVRADGRVAGVRVVSHKETPGLGDYIEIGRSDWIRQFDGKSAAAGTDAWRVRKDGGQFDFVAGATITPRAIVRAVKRALDFHAANRDLLYAPAAPAPEASK